MSVLYDSILDNLKRNLSNQELYSKQLNNLPKGKIVIRKKRKSDYYYLEFREKEKILYKYLGPVLIFDISDIQSQIKERKILNERIKRLKIEEKEMMKVLKSLGYNRWITTY